MKTIAIVLIAVTWILSIEPLQGKWNNSSYVFAAQTDSGTDTEQLLQRVRERGSVRVWIYYKMEEYQREGLLETESQVREQRSDIENMHNHLMNELADRGLNVSGVNKLHFYPAAVMSVDEETLKYLLEAPFVKRIRLGQSFRTRTNESTSIIEADIDASEKENWNDGKGFEPIKKRWKPTADQRSHVFTQSLPDSEDPIPEIYQTRIDRGTEENDRTNNAPDYHRNYIYVEAWGYALGSVNYQRRLPWSNIAAGGGIGIVPGQSTPMNALDRLNAISLFVLKQYKLTNHFWYGFGLGGTYDYGGYTDYDNFYDPFYVTMALNRYSVSREYRGYLGAGLYYVRWEENWRILPAIRVGFSF